MAESTISPKVQTLVLDLRMAYPRSPRAKLAGYVIAARAVDKCRAVLAGVAGAYQYDCLLDSHFLEFSGIKADELKAFIAGGADDEEVAAWIKEHAKTQSAEDIVVWNNRMRAMRICDLPVKAQVFLEGYVEEFLPAGRAPHLWFDVYDIEEKRLWTPQDLKGKAALT